MGNFSSNLLQSQNKTSDEELSAAMLDNASKPLICLEKNPKSNIKDKSAKTKKKRSENKIDDMILDKQGLLPEQFANLERLKNYHLTLKEKKKQLAGDLLEWDLDCIPPLTGVTCLTVTHDRSQMIMGTTSGLLGFFTIFGSDFVCLNYEPGRKIHSIAVSEDNKIVVAAIETDIYFFKNGQMSCKKKVHRGRIRSVLISDTHVISGSDDCSIKIFDLNTEQEVHHFTNIHQAPITCMALSNDKTCFVSASEDASLKIFDLNTKMETHHFPGVHAGPINSVNISFDGKYIMTGSEDCTIKIFSLKEREEFHQFKGISEDPISATIFTKDSKFIMFGTKKGVINVFDLEKKEEIGGPTNFDMNIISMARIGNKLLLASSEGKIIYFDLKTAEITPFCYNDYFENGLVAISTDNNYIACQGGPLHHVLVYDFEERNKVPKVVPTPPGFISCLAILSEKKWVVFGCRRSLYVVDFRNMRKIHELKDIYTGSSTNDFQIKISSDERGMLLKSSRNTVKLFATQNFKEIREIRFDFAVDTCFLSYDNAYIIAGSSSETRVQDSKTDRVVFNVDVGGRDVIMSRGSKFIVIVQGNKADVFDLETSSLIYSIKIGDHLPIEFTTTPVALMEDNRYIICGFQSNIKVFDFETRQEVYSYLIEDKLASFAFSDDNQHIIAGDSKGKIKVFRLNTKSQEQAINWKPLEETEFRSGDFWLWENLGWIVLTQPDGSLKIFDAHTTEEIYNSEIPELSSYQSLGIPKSGPLIAISSYDNDQGIVVFNLETKKEECRFEFKGLLKTKDVLKMAASENGRLIAVGKEDSTILFDVDAKKEKWKINKTSVRLAISNDEKYLFSADRSHDINIFDLQTAQKLYTFKDDDNNSLTDIKVSNDSKKLLAYFLNNQIKIFDIETKQKINEFNLSWNKEYMNFATLTSDDRYMIFETERAVYKVSTWTGVKVEEFYKEDAKFGVVVSKDNKKIFTLHSMLYSHFGDSNETSYASSKINNASPFCTVYEDFLTSLSSKDDPEFQRQLLLCCQDLDIIPHHWTVLHFLAIFNPYGLSKIPEYSQFPVPFLVDNYGKTPLHYLLAQKTRDYTIINLILQYMIDYILDKNRITGYEHQKICSSLSGCFLFILSKGSLSLVKKFLNICYSETYPQHGQTLPSFGESEENCLFYELPVIQNEILPRLHKKGDDRIIFRTNMIHFDYNPKSNDMFKTTHVLSEIEQEIIFKIPLIKKLIDHLWQTTGTTMYLTALAFSTLMILLSFYIASSQQSFYLEMIIIFLTSLFIVSEVIQVITLGLEYLESIWNWLDVTQLFMTLIFMLTKLDGREIPGEAWIVSALITAGYLRWLSYLRLFGATRILIEIILAVMYDMIGFIAVIASILLGFSLIFLEFGRNESNPQDYGFHFYNAFKLLFGNYDDSNYDLSQTILVSLLMCVLNVVLLNLLISIIGDSFGKIQEGRELVDAKTRLNMIQEAIIMMRCIRPKKTIEKGYLIYKLPATMEEEDLENLEWEDRINKIQKTFKQTHEEGHKNLKSGIKNLEKELDIVQFQMKKNIEQVDGIKNDIKGMREHVKDEVKENVEQAMKSIKEEMIHQVKQEVDQIKDDMQGLKEMVTLVLANLNEITKTVKPTYSPE